MHLREGVRVFKEKPDIESVISWAKQESTPFLVNLMQQDLDERVFRALDQGIPILIIMRPENGSYTLPDLLTKYCKQH